MCAWTAVASDDDRGGSHRPYRPYHCVVGYLCATAFYYSPVTTMSIVAE